MLTDLTTLILKRTRTCATSSNDLWKENVGLEPDGIDFDVGEVGVDLLGVDGHGHRGGRLVPVVPAVHYAL